MSFTHSSILPMLAACTPQSMSIWAGPFFPGTVNRKKSPNPTRYMRTRMLAGPPLVVGFAVTFGAGFAAGVAFPVDFRARAALLTFFCGSFLGALSRCPRGSLSGTFSGGFACSHDQYSSCSRPKLAWKWVGS